MSRATVYQIGIIIFTGLFLTGKQLFKQNSDILSSIQILNQSSILLTLLTIVSTIWGCALLFHLQNQKGKPLFQTKIWRIMPVILSVLLILSFIGFIILGLTVYSTVTVQMHWQIDLLVIYFLSLFYLLILSIINRYGKKDTPASKITLSANIAVILVIIILFFIPGI